MTIRLAKQASLPAQIAAEAIAEYCSQLQDRDVFIDHEDGQRVIRDRGVVLAVVSPDGTITAFASNAEMDRLTQGAA